MIEVGFACNDPDEPCESAGAVERALRAAQHLHPVDIHEPQIGIRRVQGNRRIVHVQADHGFA